MTTTSTALLAALPDTQALAELEQKFDPEMRFRPLAAGAAMLVGGLLIVLSLFHYYTAGFGLLQEITHRGVHLAFVLGLIFLVVPHRRAPRRCMGWPLPIIAIAFMAHAMAEPVFPGLLMHAGARWSQLVKRHYLTSRGICGAAVGVVAAYVFHFVLFGVLAARIGLGQRVLNVASSIAGRYAGGPAKVNGFGSAVFGRSCRARRGPMR